ncbi:tetratricopeptide repeat protein [Desulfogranum marinum]|uniref:tetratricopeptide repeat protein n=1 Tax=Desulfogranum marinum TaxID=453220 RepID=UPI0019650D55|nr:tetratricopeptide repeat protein [Desulfogranum marinum]MBM9513196.1 hypothetical protein [Desulfogranum marinum]
MRYLFILFSILVTCLPATFPLNAEASSRLKAINRTDETSSLQLYLRFTELPQYEVNQRQKRVDLLLKNTTLDVDIELPGSDDRIIRILNQQQKEDTLVSVFFRYPPQKITEKKRDDPASLMLDILLGNQFTSLYPDLSTQFKGLTLLTRETIDYTNPIYLSPYADKWRSFFNDYETPLTIDLPTTYTLPPFPLTSILSKRSSQTQWLTTPILENASAGEWRLVNQQVQELLENETDENRRDLLLLTYAESLVRSDQYKEAYPLLQKIISRYPDTQTAAVADFLFAYLRNKHEADFLGYQEVSEAIRGIGSSTPFNDFFSILSAEIALKNGNINQARQNLTRDDIGFSETANAIRLMRLADTYYLEDKKIKALVAYLQLQDFQPVIDRYPESLAMFSDVLYTFKRYKQAEASYETLAEILNDQRQYDLVLFRIAMSNMHDGAPRRQTEQKLSQVMEAFTRTEGTFRAEMKQADIDYLAGDLTPEKALDIYSQLAIAANTIALREEATFKQTLVHLLSGDPESALQKARLLLREFQSGALRDEARALIIQQLPDMTARLVQEKRYVEALVLAQQNRRLFTRGWIPNTMLYNLATAYSNLGFFDRSARTYQYLFETTTGDEQEKIYLPLIQSLFQDGQYTIIEDYADRFSFRYPESSLAPEIFYLRLKALLMNGDMDKAASLLRNPDRPLSNEIDQLALSIYYDLEQWENIIQHFETVSITQGNGDTTQKIMMLAESYFQTDQSIKAEPLFEQIIEKETGNDQAWFRLAQIAQGNNNIQQALNRFKQVAEKGVDPLWKKLAGEEIAILQLQQTK